MTTKPALADALPRVLTGREIVSEWIEDELKRTREVHVSETMRERLAHQINLSLGSALAQGYRDGLEASTEPVERVRRETIEKVVKIIEGFASGHHFAGDMAGEKSFRRCIVAVKEMIR